MENASEYTQIVFEIAKQDEKTQERIMQALKNQLTSDEYKAILIGVSYFRMMLKKAMTMAICEQLYFEFTGKELNI